jgi:hypothetical protein
VSEQAPLPRPMGGLQESVGKLASVVPKQITPSNIERKVTP